jgi:predicted GNAT family acetyltransferase
MALTVHRPALVDAFLELAGDFLAAREAEHNLLFGICTAIRTTPELFAEDPPSFAVVTNDDVDVVLASLRTPPHNLVLSQADDPEAIDALVDALAGEQLPGVVAPSEAVTRFVDRWCARTGQSSHLEVAERIFRLERVIPPARPAPGRWRIAEPRDRDLVAKWVVAFSAEAMPEAPPIDDPAATADRWIAGIYRRLYLWEDGGSVVSVVGAGGETPSGIRIGPVYTPPERRGRGYATSLTAAASQDQLDRGRRFCFLFTDLSNPTSNKIYQAIGYEPVCDVDMVRFDLPSSP